MDELPSMGLSESDRSIPSIRQVYSESDRSSPSPFDDAALDRVVAGGEQLAEVMTEEGEQLLELTEADVEGEREELLELTEADAEEGMMDRPMTPVEPARMWSL